ncbi:MAG: IS200/IS605 family transposase [Phycisphaerales bacterium]|jgi:putative transposase|nr:IS200/IS605 family transposase [Phycisphaerales bacterium]MBT7170490.1 IS200/IS605 family transposase [Phycisphaerales bacterium]
MSFSDINFHVVYATKGRKPFLDKETIQRLADYSGGIIRKAGGVLLAANGTADHLHLLLALQPTCTPAEVIRDIKANSSRWIHETFPDNSDFAWQDGYSIFSVSQSVVPNVVSYIQTQPDHHKRMSFQDELRSLLDRHEIEYDERYL